MVSYLATVILLLFFWISVIIAYGWFFYKQRYNIQLYFSTPQLLWIIFPIGIPLIWSGVEIFHFIIQNHFLFRLWVTIIPLSLNYIIPLILGFKILGFYTDFHRLPQYIRKWDCFGPYFIPQSNNRDNLKIIWGYSPRASSKDLQWIKIGEESTLLKKKRPELILKKRGYHVFYYHLSWAQYPRGFYYQIASQKNSLYVPKSHFIYPSSTQLSPNEKFEFIAVSDLHADNNLIEKQIEIINNISPTARFICCSGDIITYGSRFKNWGRFFVQFRSLLVDKPFFTCPGNHDCDTRKKATYWQRLFPYTPITQGRKPLDFFYTLAYGPIRFFFLDLYNAGSNPRLPNNSQMDRLEEELNSTSEEVKIKILILHNSIYCTGEFGCDTKLEQLLIPLIERYNISVILSGHAHIFESFYRKSSNSEKHSLFLVNGGGGGKLDEIVLRAKNFPTVPYQWKDRTHIAKENPYFEGNPNHPFRNDPAVLQYQEIGIISHSWLRFIVNSETISIICYDWNGKILYEKNLKYI